ncbi:hypothetical protein Dimus_023197 [Dionaea muscipula]
MREKNIMLKIKYREEIERWSKIKKRERYRHSLSMLSTKQTGKARGEGSEAKRGRKQKNIGERIPWRFYRERDRKMVRIKRMRCSFQPASTPQPNSCHTGEERGKSGQPGEGDSSKSGFLHVIRPGCSRLPHLLRPLDLSCLSGT